MPIKSEKILGKKIMVEIESSNLKRAEYTTDEEKLVVEFNNSQKYEYEKVPWEVFTKMRSAKSQGSFFSKNIARSFKYKKI